jgi:hypothetical protein
MDHVHMRVSIIHILVNQGKADVLDERCSST